MDVRKASLLVILSLLAGACAPAQVPLEPPTAVPSPPPWLLHPACALPCWKNIVPQETRFSDALSLLNQAGIRVTSTSADEIAYQTEGTTGAIIGDENGQVSSIILVPARDSVPLSELMVRLPPPEELDLGVERHDTQRCNAAILFAWGGTIAEASWENQSTDASACMVTIGPTSTIFRLVLVGPGAKDSVYWAGRLAGRQMSPWRGFGVYP